MSEKIYAVLKNKIAEGIRKNDDAFINTMSDKEVQAFIKDLDSICGSGAFGVYRSDDIYFCYDKKISDGYKKDFNIEFIPAIIDENGEISMA